MNLMDILYGFGAVLDTPGAILRNTLAGEDPFLGLMTPEDRTTGRQMLESMGVLGENTDGFDWGDVAGFGVEMVADPLAFLGSIKGATGLGRAAHRFSKESVKHPTAGMFGLGDFSRLGREAPRQLADEEAASLWGSWANKLTPEEEAAIGFWTDGPIKPVTNTLRGIPNDLELLKEVRSYRGMPKIDNLQAIESELAPYLDSALAKGATPDDIMSYRVAGQFADITPQNAHEFIGKTVSDPSYLSTTITPYGAFYGASHAGPTELKIDMILPRGTPAGYVGSGIEEYTGRKLSGHALERELVLPRDQQFRVVDVKDMPGVTLGKDSYILSENGLPIPTSGGQRGLREIYEADAPFMDNLNDAKRLFPSTTWDQPQGLEQYVLPGWRSVVESGEPNRFTNVLLEAIPGSANLSPASPGYRRLTKDEQWDLVDEVIAPLLAGSGRPEQRLARFAGSRNVGAGVAEDILKRAGMTNEAQLLNDMLVRSFDEPAQAANRLRQALTVGGVGASASAPLLMALLGGGE